MGRELGRQDTPTKRPEKLLPSIPYHSYKPPVKKQTEDYEMEEEDDKYS